ncbi:MAG TPA: hypothetical protein VIN61_14635 [Gammaproteobacteria bacterium]
MNKTTQNEARKTTKRFGGLGEVAFHLALVAAVVGVLIERATYLSSGTIV